MNTCSKRVAETGALVAQALIRSTNKGAVSGFSLEDKNQSTKAHGRAYAQKLSLLILLMARVSVIAADFPIVDTPDYKGVIIPAADAAERFARNYAGFWTPTAEEVAKAETRISAYLDASKEKYASRERSKLKWFRRQYFGYTKEGEKRIFCNFLPGVKDHGDSFEELRQGFLSVHDGGPDYWRIHYNFATNDCSQFHVDEGY
jgi:hypothetical protein